MRLLVASHAGVSRRRGAWRVFERVGELVSRLDSLGWEVTLLARSQTFEEATHALPDSVRIVRPRTLAGVVAALRADAILALMPAPASAVAAALFGRRCVMYAGGSWELRADFARRRVPLERLATRRAAVVVAHGFLLQDHFARRARRVVPAVPHVNAEVADRLLRDPPLRRGDESVRVLFVGGLKREKGVLDVLAAARALPHVEFRLVGAPKQKDMAREAEAAAAELRNVSLLEYAPWERLRDEYRRANVLALPSHSEGFPRVVYEGAAFGLAPVVTPVGGLPAVLVHRRSGLFVPVAGAAALAAAIGELAQDQRLRAELAAGARAAVAPLFAGGDAARQLDRLLRAVCQPESANASRSPVQSPPNAAA
jgi:glycosyltransferase involved in cell wall biosynthesis